MSEASIFLKKRFFVSFFFFGFKRPEPRYAQKHLAQIHLLEYNGSSAVEMTLYEDWFRKLMPQSLITEGQKSTELFWIDLAFEKVDMPSYQGRFAGSDVAEINAQFLLKRTALSVVHEYNTELSVESYAVGLKDERRVLEVCLCRENSNAQDSFQGKFSLSEDEFSLLKNIPRNALFRPVFSLLNT